MQETNMVEAIYRSGTCTWVQYFQTNYTVSVTIKNSEVCTNKCIKKVQASGVIVVLL